jgi:Kef-type K+ transport system membrane component KefB
VGIIGAFAAGLLLARARNTKIVERVSRPAAKLLAPVFFVMVGAKADLSACGWIVAPLIVAAVE